jgi:hypothetical protein
VATGDGEGHHDPVADRQLRDLIAHRHDDAHRFVAQDVAPVDERPEQLIQVQVGAADRGRGDLHDCVGRCLDARVGYLVDTQLASALPGQCLHRCILSSSSGQRSLSVAPTLGRSGAPAEGLAGAGKPRYGPTAAECPA